MVTIGVVGWCLMVHYPLIYIVGFLSIVGLYGVILLEERELIVRFGDDYKAYKNSVPRLLPGRPRRIVLSRYDA